MSQAITKQVNATYSAVGFGLKESGPASHSSLTASMSSPKASSTAISSGEAQRTHSSRRRSSPMPHRSANGIQCRNCSGTCAGSSLMAGRCSGVMPCSARYWSHSRPGTMRNDESSLMGEVLSRSEMGGLAVTSRRASRPPCRRRPHPPRRPMLFWPSHAGCTSRRTGCARRRT